MEKNARERRPGGPCGDQEGFVLVLVCVITLLVAMIALAASKTSVAERWLSTN